MSGAVAMDGHGGDGDDEDAGFFRSAGTEDDEGVGDAVVPALDEGVEDVEEDERKPGVSSAGTETSHGNLATVALPRCLSEFFRKRKGDRGEEKGGAAAERRGEGLGFGRGDLGCFL